MRHEDFIFEDEYLTKTPGEWMELYGDGYIGVKEDDGTISPVRVVGVETKPRRLLYVKKGNINSLNLMNNERDRLMLTYPKLGYVNDNRSAFYLAAPAARQWSRAFRPGGIKIKTAIVWHEKIPKNWFIGLDSKVRINLGHLGMDEKILWQIYNPTHFNINELLALLSEGSRLSGSISRNFAISLAPRSSQPVVEYKGEYLIGVVEEDGIIVLSKAASHLIEELSQYAQCKMQG